MPTPKQDAWLNSTLGVDPASYPSPGNGQAQSDPASGVTKMANGGGGSADNLDAPPLAATDASVFFSRNSSDLTPADKAALQTYINRYVAAATPTPITLTGYASMDGDAATNTKLAQARADAVKSLMAQTIKAELITATGQGATAQFQNGAAAANRRVDFGPPVAAPTATAPGPDAKPAAPAAPQKLTTTVNPTPNIPVTDKQFTDIFGADLLGQWNAFRTKSGPVPPSAQLTLTLTLKGSLKHQDKGNLTVDWIDEPSIAVVFNSSGPVAANDQEAISLVKLHWENTVLKKPIELSVLGVTQNLFTKGATPQEGVQPQAKLLLTKQIGVVVGAQFMLGQGDSGKFGLNATGFAGIDVTAF